ncbi:hypothetical protein [Mycoplasmopsis cynos]|uniref:hypothetical protein n=1 Tax=Mycoplasmopsis cynos TaxID=171284 RepID=UPI002AFEF00B|nr:hypothetical protein [Mycoplasmopsis cynos]WQQ14528.1 hypothetical protein RRG42_02880 [Mycoplasmopsis cynos]
MKETALLVVVDPKNELGLHNPENFNITNVFNRHSLSSAKTDDEFCELLRWKLNEASKEYKVCSIIDPADFINNGTLNEGFILTNWLNAMENNANFFIEDGINANYLFVPKILIQNGLSGKLIYTFSQFREIVIDQLSEKLNREPNEREINNVLINGSNHLFLPMTSNENFTSRTIDTLSKSVKTPVRTWISKFIRYIGIFGVIATIIVVIIKLTQSS